jgi:serine protease
MLAAAVLVTVGASSMRAPARAAVREAPVTPGVLLVRYRGDRAPYRKLRLPPGMPASEALRSLRSRADVLYAGEEAVYRLLAAPNDPFYRNQWNLRNAVPGSVHVEPAWEQLAEHAIVPGAGAIVAVVDTGIAFEDYQGLGFNGQLRDFARLPDFAATTFVFPFHAVRGDSHANDEVSHGTHVAGTIAAGMNDGVGAAGIAPGAALIPVNVTKIVGGGDVQLPESAVADGLRWAADHGADVINMSFGGRRPSEIIADAVTYARGKGCLLVAAAGNDWEDRLVFPAMLDAEVVAVSALGYDGRIAPYSTYGQGLALSAPGGNYALDGDRNLRPDGIEQQAFEFLGDPTEFKAVMYEGTSMAAPHVCGVAALLRSTGISGEAGLRGALLRSAVGKGKHSPQYGWGRVDAARAVQKALDPTPPDPQAGRSLRVEAIQMLFRSAPGGFVPEIRVRLSDSLFRPVAAATVTLKLSGKGLSAPLTAVTDEDGLATVTGPLVTLPWRALVRAKLTSVRLPGASLRRPLCGELSESAQVPPH